MQVFYVDRDEGGGIVTRHARPQFEGQEYLKDDDPEIIELEKADQDEESCRIVLNELAEIDAKSIRGLREWVVAQAGAPTELVSLEAEAGIERDKLSILPPIDMLVTKE